ncbi:nitroreductase [Burkholderia multivorans]|uniref:nitroreductase family protein n=1 Tax=Burkholderia multivorans TaxID=87883 RepID=UPI0009BD7ABD|nr:nitroreductase [Burkholderia multivorans]
MFEIDDIINRKSCSEFFEAQPSVADIDVILKAAESANDHGHLRPWEFRVYTGAGRERLTNAFLLHVTSTEGGKKEIEKARKAAFRAPVVVCVSTLRRESRVPYRDQLFSAVATCQLITLGAHLTGYAAIWRTGVWATSATVRAALGIKEHDEIVGFVYIGKAMKPSKSTRIHSLENILRHD